MRARIRWLAIYLASGAAIEGIVNIVHAMLHAFGVAHPF